MRSSSASTGKRSRRRCTSPDSLFYLLSFFQFSLILSRILQTKTFKKRHPIAFHGWSNGSSRRGSQGAREQGQDRGPVESQGGHEERPRANLHSRGGGSVQGDRERPRPGVHVHHQGQCRCHRL